MLEGLARLGDVGTRVINQSAANTVADLQLLQPILTQLAAAGPDLAGSLELLLTYPFPDSSLSALNYREAQTGGYALFTNMTATREPRPDRAALPVRDRPDAGALVEVAAEDVVARAVRRRPGPAPGAPDTGTDRRRGGRRALPVRRPTASPAWRGAAARPPTTPAGLLGLPSVPGVTAVITRKTKLKLLAFAALAVLGMSYLGFNYVGLDRALLGSGYEVAADFRDSGGIFVNAEVTYRGRRGRPGHAT